MSSVLFHSVDNLQVETLLLQEKLHSMQLRGSSFPAAMRQLKLNCNWMWSRDWLRVFPTAQKNGLSFSLLNVLRGTKLSGNRRQVCMRWYVVHSTLKCVSVWLWNPGFSGARNTWNPTKFFAAWALMNSKSKQRTNMRLIGTCSDTIDNRTSTATNDIDVRQLIFHVKTFRNLPVSVMYWCSGQHCSVSIQLAEPFHQERGADLSCLHRPGHISWVTCVKGWIIYCHLPELQRSRPRVWVRYMFVYTWSWVKSQLQRRVGTNHVWSNHWSRVRLRGQILLHNICKNLVHADVFQMSRFEVVSLMGKALAETSWQADLHDICKFPLTWPLCLCYVMRKQSMNQGLRLLHGTMCT